MNPCENLPWNGSSFLGEVACSSCKPARAPNPNDFISPTHLRQTRNVQKGHIHGHSSENGAKFSANQGMSPVG